jgi:DNA-binding CsgD family transcriptional regulator
MSMRLLEESTTSPLNRIGPHTRIGLIHARRGGHGVWKVLDQALAEVIGTNQPMCIGPVRIARAEAFWLEGRPDDAVLEAESAADLADDLDPCLRGAVRVWLRRLGSERRVDGEVAEPYRLALLGRCADAAGAWDAIGCGYDAAMTLLDASDENSLRFALQRFDELGAVAAARLARQRLRKLGVRSIPVGPRRATRAHPFGLTQRERQVLELVCARRTNAEIAQELFISAKTVDHHVSAVLAKLDAENREGAAAIATRLGLVAPAAAQPTS